LTAEKIVNITKHRGMELWHNAALASFALIAISLTWAIMNSGFSSSEAVKDVLEKSVTKSSIALKVIGKMVGTAQVVENKVTVTAIPLSVTANNALNLTSKSIKVTYKIVKDQSYVITYDDIYSGALIGKSYNSLNEAMAAAKENGLIKINPITDKEKPDTTSAFFYWVINQNSDEYLQNNEIANLVVVNSDNDRPATGEYMKIQVVDRYGVILELERTIPNISSVILDLGGKIKAKT
jgi:flagellin FlaB